MEERRQERESRLLKFEGEDRIHLNGVIRAVARELGEEDLKKAKKLVIDALTRNGTIEYITEMIITVALGRLKKMLEDLK